MARMGRNPARPGRVTIAVMLGTVGLFVISAAAGGTSWPLGAFGAAMLVLAVALLTTASMRGSDKTYVAGTVHVSRVLNEPPTSAEFGRCDMEVLVDAPGHPGQTVTVRDPRVPIAKWPDVGDTLPALVAVADPRRIKIQWERVGVFSDYSEPDEFAHDERAFDPLAYDDVYVPETPRTFDGGSPLPRRQAAPASVGVLEGEVVPSPRQPSDQDVNIVDFADLIDQEPVAAEPEPPAPPEWPMTRVSEDSPPVSSTMTGPIVSPPAARPASAGTIHGVGITVLVTDLARSLAFYRDMLGFYEIDSGPGNVILASSDTRIVLKSTSEVPSGMRLVHLNLEVGDVDAIYGELKVRGVRFTYPPRVVNSGERLELWAAAFKDPDGHGIAITQWKARQS